MKQNLKTLFRYSRLKFTDNSFLIINDILKYRMRMYMYTAKYMMYNVIDPLFYSFSLSLRLFVLSYCILFIIYLLYTGGHEKSVS